MKRSPLSWTTLTDVTRRRPLPVTRSQGSPIAGCVALEWSRGTLRAGISRYVCPEEEKGGCGKITVDARLADERVREYVLDTLTAHADAIAKALGTVDVAALEREAAQIARRQTELAEEWARGDLDRAEWRAARDVLTERSEQIERERKAAGRRAPALPRDRDGLADLWEAATETERRELVRLVVNRVEVGPGARGPMEPGENFDLLKRSTGAFVD